MRKSAILLLASAIVLALTPAWAAKKKSMEEIIEDGKKAADNMAAESAQKREAEKKAMEDYWDAQPEAEPVVPGGLLSKLKKIPWPDVRPVAKEKYFPRPEVKADAPADEEEYDPLMAGAAKKEKAAQRDLEAVRKESDAARFDLWLKNIDFYVQKLDACAAGRLEGAERVKTIESALAFVKEGQPEFYLKSVADRGVKYLKEMETRIKEMTAALYQEGLYVPDYKALFWAEETGGKIAAGLPGVTEKEKSRYSKIIARVRNFDPRAPEAEAAGGGALAGAPAAGAAKDAKWEQFLRGLAGRCNKTISGLNLMTAQPAEYPALLARVEKEINAILASFPAGWQKYPRAKWAHNWFTGALDKNKKAADPMTGGRELFKALNDYETGLGPERE